MRRIAAALCAFAWLSTNAAALTIYLEDDHAGSFHHLAATLDLDEPHALLLIDAHSDASAVLDSDSVRAGLRRVTGPDQRGARLATWRSEGRVQAFSWIEPLMPAPFAEVWWLAPPGGDRSAQLKMAREQLDARLAFDARGCGELGGRYRMTESVAIESDLPVVASIDLDYFAGLSPDAAAARFESLWAQALALPNLHCVTFSVSRPWLPDDATAHGLVGVALRAALSVRNAEVRFEPFVPRGPDRSERAKELFAQGKTPPRYDIATAPDDLRALILSELHRIDVRVDVDRWKQLIDDWRAESGEWRIVVDDAQPSTDEIWRLTDPATLRVRAQPREAIPHRVRWLLRSPEKWVHNILPEMSGSKLFAKTGTPFVRDIEIELAVTQDGTLPAAAWSEHLDAKTGFGSTRIVAEIIGGEGSPPQRTPEIEIRVSPEGLGRFRAALAEQFNLPYVFGAGLLVGGGETGPETRSGNDCANFLVYAWRRSGHSIGWCDPLRLSRHLKSVATDITVESQPAIDAEMIERGLAVHCGKHIAAMWQDREPLGVLDGGDLVAHHLSGPPEIITLAALIKARPEPQFDLLVMPLADSEFSLVAGGDICLAESHTPSFPGFVAEADLAVANLECALTNRKNPRLEKNYLFRAPPDSAAQLTAAGFDALSLANNHTRDFGDAGQNDTRSALDAAGLAGFGLSAWTTETPAGPLSLLGINFVENDRVEEDTRVLAENIRKARGQGDTVIVFPHWGDEFTEITTAEQRRRARWLVDLGADAVIGAGPHCWQPLDFYRGRPIYYSLGNAYFPPRGPVPGGFHESHWARIAIDSIGRLTATTK